MNDPPDPGGGMDFVQPPSPAAFTSISSSVDEKAFEIVNRKRRSEKRNVTKDPRSDRSRSRTKSMVHDETTCKFTDASDVVLQAGQCTPPNSFSPSSSSPLPSGPPAASQKTSFTPIGRQLYDSTDRGPFTVHVQREETSPTAGTSLHPVTFGRFLFSRAREFQGIIDGSIKNVGRNRIALNFHSAISANNFIQSPSLPNNKLRAFIPSFNITRMGIIRGIPVDMTPEDVMSEMKVPEECGPILKVRRLNFKVSIDGVVTWKPSQTVVLTFDGQILPSRVYLCYNSFPVAAYAFPTIQCFHCCRYGHTMTQCRSKPACFKCGSNHLGKSCNVDEVDAKCLWCGGNHFANSKYCPEMQRQNNIKSRMSELSISYAEASQFFPAYKKSFAEVTSTSVAAPLPSPSRNLTTEPSKVHYRGGRKSMKSHILPSSSVGYDREAHMSIIREESSGASQNGCALLNPLAQKNETPSVQAIIAELLQLLNLLSSLMSNSSSSSNSPSNAAFNLNSLISLLQNGSL